MGLLDDLLGQSGGQGLGAIAKIAAQNPQLVQAALSLLSHNQGSIGGPGGLGGLIGAFEKGGLGNVMSSWVGGGPNLPVDAGQLASALGPDVLGQVAQHAGVSPTDAAGGLASILPELINHLTPSGQVPAATSLESTLGSLLGALGK
jgi:uncharacterized protein YidB (DUF937 family)